MLLRRIISQHNETLLIVHYIYHLPTNPQRKGYRYHTEIIFLFSLIRYFEVA